MNDDPPENVVVAVEDQGLEFLLPVARGRREVGDDGLEKLVDAQPLFRGHRHRHLGVQAQVVVDLVAHGVPHRVLCRHEDKRDA